MSALPAPLPSDEPRVRPPAPADYALPDAVRATAPPDALRELEELLRELAALRARAVGLTEAEARATYDGDELVLLLRAELTRWLVDHVARRVRRPSPRDRGCPLRKWIRITAELVWVDDLASLPESAHEVVFHGVLRHVLTELYEATLGPHVHVVDIDILVVDLDGTRGAMARRVAEWLYRDVHGVVRKFALARPACADGVDGDPAALRAELATMARDLVEISAVLADEPDVPPVAVAHGLRARFVHDRLHFAGTIELEPGLTDKPFRIPVDLGGVLRDVAAPWKDLGDDLLAWSVGLMRPIHAAHVDAWARARCWRPVAVVDDPEPLDASPGPSPRVPAVRATPLLAMLERRFGCEVRQGKGSEITVWRPGGRKFTLPHHRKNTHYEPRLLRSMLKAVGIPAEEFAAVAQKRA